MLISRAQIRLLVEREDEINQMFKFYRHRGPHYHSVKRKPVYLLVYYLTKLRSMAWARLEEARQREVLNRRWFWNWHLLDQGRKLDLLSRTWDWSPINMLLDWFVLPLLFIQRLRKRVQIRRSRPLKRLRDAGSSSSDPIVLE